MEPPPFVKGKFHVAGRRTGTRIVESVATRSWAGLPRTWTAVKTVPSQVVDQCAVTSTRGWIRRLGRRWGQLHRLVYAAGVLAVLHYLWLVKSDLREPLIYGGVLALLLGLRLWWRLRRPAAVQPPARGA